jgi:phosphate ABC transporter phosphate-binding protein
VGKWMSQASLIRIGLYVLVGVGIGILIYKAPAFFITNEEPAPRPHLKMGGTSVAQIIVENRWKTAYRDERGVLVQYESTGSTNGITQMIDKKYAICFTHGALTEEQKKQAKDKGGDVVHIPVTLCAVVPVYNVKELNGKPPLNFTGEVLADIYRGKIEKWNDQALKKLNEGVELPDTKIVVVHREDSSGTTYIFTDYLAGTSEPWQKEIGAGKSEIKWPVGVAKARTNGVAEYVRETDGAIGYVDLMNAWNAELEYGAVQNKDKTAFIHAEADNMAAAAKGLAAEVPEDLTFKLTNKPGKDAYPICGGVFAVCYQNQPASEKQLVAEFLHWVTHDGQKYARRTSYAPLPEDLVERIDKKLETIRAVQ